MDGLLVLCMNVIISLYIMPAWIVLDQEQCQRCAEGTAIVYDTQFSLKDQILLVKNITDW